MLLGGRYRRIRLPFAFFLVCALLADDRSGAVDGVFAPYRSEHAPGCAVGVVQNGSFLYLIRFGMADVEAQRPLTPSTPFQVASISKQFTAAAIFFLWDRGAVRLDDPVRKFVPELPALTQDITVADLLHHTSGLRDIFPLLEVAAPPQILDIAGNLKLLAAQSGLNFPPGTNYEYANSDYLLLDLIVERVSGVALADFARQHIFAPLAMNHTAFPGGKQELAGVAREYSARGSRFRHSIPPLVAGDGGLQTSVEDFALWDENFYTPTVGGKRMVDFLEEPGRLRSGMLVRYAAGLELAMFRGLPAIGHDGVLPGSRSDLVRFPTQHLTVMCLCSRSISAIKTGLCLRL